MKRILSPSFFLIAIIAFFLPFVSVSCNAGALSGLGELGEGLGGEAGEEVPDLGGFPGSGGGEVELVSATGLDIVLGTEVEAKGLGELGEGLEGFGEGLEGLGGTDTPAVTPDTSTGDSFPGQIWAILALVAAVAGIGLSFLRAKVGGLAAIIAGALGVISLFLLRSAISGEVGQASLVGFSINYKLGFWLAMAGLALGAVGGVIVMMEGQGTAVATDSPPEPPPPTDPPPAE